MRLWHESLIPILPDKQILGGHRECCALRGKSWGRKHIVVDYVFKHIPAYLEMYHTLIIREMSKRGFKYNEKWIVLSLKYYNIEDIYTEHDDFYLIENLLNLERKGIHLFDNFRKKIEPYFKEQDFHRDFLIPYRSCKTQKEIYEIQKRFYSWVN